MATTTSTSKHRATFRWTNDSWDNPAPNNPHPSGANLHIPPVGSIWSQPSRSVMAKLIRHSPAPWSTTSTLASGRIASSRRLQGTEANIVPALQAAYPAAWPSSLKQKDEFFGAWGGFGPYGSYRAMPRSGILLPTATTKTCTRSRTTSRRYMETTASRLAFFYSTNAKIESNGNGADRPSLPNGNIYTGPGSLGSIDANAQTGNALANVLLPGTGTNPQMFSGITENSIDGIAAVHWHDFEPYFGDSWKIRRNLTIDFGFRWSIYREPYGGTTGGNTNPAYNRWRQFPKSVGQLESIGIWSAAEAAANPSDACNGTLIVPGTTPCAECGQAACGSGGKPASLQRHARTKFRARAAEQPQYRSSCGHRLGCARRW